jgi:RES domain-containing protein
LSQTPLPLAKISSTWFRFSPKRYPSPIFWSRQGIYRFDSPDARWGVRYLASSIVSTLPEVFGDKINRRKPIDWKEIEQRSVWLVRTPDTLRGFELFNENLSVIGASLQCFVSSYPKSQRWGAALMRHPSDLEALVYMGRKSEAPCLAMLGASDNQRAYQSLLQTQCLGALSAWEELLTTLDRFRVRLSSMPASRKRTRGWATPED